MFKNSQQLELRQALNRNLWKNKLLCNLFLKTVKDFKKRSKLMITPMIGDLIQNSQSLGIKFDAVVGIFLACFSTVIGRRLHNLIKMKSAFETGLMC